MEVYIEYVLLDNLIINSVLLNLTNKTLKLKASKWNIFFSAVLGTIIAIILPLIEFGIGNVFNNLIFILIKICLGLAMCFILKKPDNFTRYMATVFLFVTYTFVLGGMCFGLMYLLNVETSFSGILLFGFEIPVGLFVLMGVFYLRIIIFLVEYVRHKCTYTNFYFDVTLKNKGESVSVTGFLDTGNQLKVDDVGLPVVNYKTIFKLCPNIDVKSLVLGDLKGSNLKNAGFINLLNSGGRSKMLTFDIEEVDIVDHKNNVLKLKNQKIGLAKTNFDGKFDCLLSMELFS
ncbi:MAG: sigma-E processing peptidase SpoIIGA [Clostridia bacterium]|nr:sigma-E processing peptidase SpoIIGA [Clostridia bacterium]